MFAQRMSLKGICCAGLTLVLTACTDSEPLLRPLLTVQYASPNANSHSPHPDSEDDHPNASSYKIDCMTHSSEFHEPAGCLYQYILITDLDKLAQDFANPGKEQEKNILVHELLSFSRSNCNRFLDRMYANREGLEFWQKLLGNFGNTASGASAFATPYASVGISVATLVTNNGMDAAKATYYKGEQSPLEIAISANRAADEATILHRLEGTAPYPVTAALADINDLDLDCSLDRGFQFLSNATQSQAQGGGIALGRLAPIAVAPPQIAIQWNRNVASAITIAPKSFVAAPGQILTLSATKSDGSTLPAWLTFNPATGILSGTPPNADDFVVKISATDTTGHSASESVRIVIP